MPLADSESLRRPSRLDALQATGLLDAPPQEALDRLTRLATKLLNVPVALVSLVDADRQFFASEVGLAEPWASQRETRLSHSFCQHVVTSHAVLVVEDARTHPLVCDNLAIPDLNVVAYAGVPLKSIEGEVLGSFCAIDSVPREWSKEQLDILDDLALAASTELQLRAAMKLLAQRQTFLADLLDHTVEMVCATNATGHIVYANGAMLSALKYTAAELARMRPADVIAEESQLSFREVGARVRAGGAVEDNDTIVVTKDGHRLICRGRATPVFGDDRTVTGARIVFRDLTSERQAQRLKNELIALVSHELRSPVGAIRSALKILVPHVSHLEGRPKQLFEMASRNADRLLVLVNDLLDIERLESGAAPLARAMVSGRSLLDHAREGMHALAERAEISLVIDADDTQVDADPARIQQVLVNLIGNALKFSPPNSTITLGAEQRTLDDGAAVLEFCVEDQGRGIPADKLTRVFERFEQVMPSDASEKGGAGLGLAICKAIVEQHGGTIWVDSVPDRGSQFRFTIPLS